MYFRKGTCLNQWCYRYTQFADGPYYYADNFGLGHGGGGDGGGGHGIATMNDTINIADDDEDNEDNNDNDKTDKNESEPSGLDAVACNEHRMASEASEVLDYEDKIGDETKVTKDCDCDSATEPGDHIPELAQNNFLKEKTLNTLDVTSVDTSEFDKRETLTTTTAATLAANYSAAELWAAIKLRTMSSK